MSLLLRFIQEEWIEQFSPFWFITCMGTGISASILHSFPYPARWLVRCSYIFFAIVSILFIFLQVIAVVQFILYSQHSHKRKNYYWNTFKNIDNNVFWGTYAMGLQTILSYIFMIATSDEVVNTKHAKPLMYVVYILWWYDIAISLVIAWGITFIIWKDYNHYFGETPDIEMVDSPENKAMKEDLQTFLLLPVITLVVACSASGTFIMSDLFTRTFNRNIQLVTLIITFLIWLHAIVFVAIILGIYVWNLYVNKLPEAKKIFSLFLCLGPLGQGAYGIVWLTTDVKLYIDLYYPVDPNIDLNGYIAKVAIGWSFQIFGLIFSMLLLATGFFFTFLCVIGILTYSRSHTKIYRYQKTWWGMTFPLGTMAIGCKELYLQFNPYVPMSAFRVVSVIYSTACVLITTTCLICAIVTAVREWSKFFRKNSRPKPAVTKEWDEHSTLDNSSSA